jgi:CheY-like chemotaxis protein
MQETINTRTPVQILVVDDNPGDVFLIVRALRGAKVSVNPSIAADGDEALAFLRQEPPFQNAPRIDIVLLDLNMPRKSGHDVLMAMRCDPKLKLIPVLILTSSASEEDVARSYSLHASAHIVKPSDLDQLGSMVHSIEDFWLRWAQLPTALSLFAA